MTEWDLKVRTKDFSHRCVKAALALPDSYLENMERPARDCKGRHKPILLMRQGGA